MCSIRIHGDQNFKFIFQVDSDDQFFSKDFTKLWKLRDENLLIPHNIDYGKLSGLSNEVKSKFKLIKPKTLGQALRIDGITPAAVYILLSHVKKRNNRLKTV